MERSLTTKSRSISIIIITTRMFSKLMINLGTKINKHLFIVKTASLNP